MARHGYAADAPFIDTPWQARKHYGKRFGIEATYRLSESSLISMTATDQTRRLLFVIISLLLQDVWRYLHWECVATPRQAGVASGSGHSRSSFVWSPAQRGTLFQFGDRLQPTSHLTSGSNDNHPASRGFA